MAPHKYCLIRCVKTDCLKVVEKKSMKRTKKNVDFYGSRGTVNELFSSSDIKQLENMKNQISCCKVLMSTLMNECEKNQKFLDSDINIGLKTSSNVKESLCKEVEEVLNSGIVHEITTANNDTEFVNRNITEDKNIEDVTIETDEDGSLDTSKFECSKRNAVQPSSVSDNFIEEDCDKKSDSTQNELSQSRHQKFVKKRLFPQDKSIHHTDVEAAAYQSVASCDLLSNSDDTTNEGCCDNKNNSNNIEENNMNIDMILPETPKITKDVHTNLNNELSLSKQQKSVKRRLFPQDESIHLADVEAAAHQRVASCDLLSNSDDTANERCCDNENSSNNIEESNMNIDMTLPETPKIAKNVHTNLNELSPSKQQKIVKKRLFPEDEHHADVEADVEAYQSVVFCDLLSSSDDTANEGCCDNENNLNNIEENKMNIDMTWPETPKEANNVHTNVDKNIYLLTENTKHTIETKNDSESKQAKNIYMGGSKKNQKILESDINKDLETTNVKRSTYEKVNEILNSAIVHENTSTPNNDTGFINRDLIEDKNIGRITVDKVPNSSKVHDDTTENNITGFVDKDFIQVENSDSCLLSIGSIVEISSSKEVENFITNNESLSDSRETEDLHSSINTKEICIKSKQTYQNMKHVTADEEGLLEISKSECFKKNTGRYNISDDEEDNNFDAEADLSENEYLPSSDTENSSEEDSEKASDNTDYALSPTKQINSVKRTLFPQNKSIQPDACLSSASCLSPNFDDTAAIQSSYVPSNCDDSADEECCDLIQKACCIHIKGFSVNADVNTVLHKGTLSGKLIRLAYEEAVTSIAISRKCHICVFPEEISQGQECAALVWKSNQTFELSSNYCLKPGKYNGEGTFFPSMKATYAPLYKAIDSNTKATTSLEVIPISTNKTKSNFCMFCSRLRTSFGRHVLKQHQDVEEVRDILKMEKGGLERKKALTKLRAKSNHVYNMAAKKLGSSERIVCRKGKLTSKTEYVSCPNCGSLFIQRNLSRHEKTCSGRSANRARILSKAKAKDEISSRPSHSTMKCRTEQKLLEKILEPIKNDEIGKIAKNDDTILQMAKRQAIARAKEPHLANNIRQEMRLMARLLAELRDIDSTVSELKDAFVPQKYEIIKEAIYRICQLDEKKFDFKLPTIALRYRSIITKCIDYIELTYIQNNVPSNSHKMDTLQNFRKVHEKMFNVYVNKKAWKTTLENRLNENKQLPTLYDIKCYNDYINSIARRSAENLKSNGFHYVDWLNLAKAMLLQIQLFNRRRSGETSRLPLKSFYNREKIPDEEKKVLSRLELLLANSIERMRNIGKRNRILSFLVKTKQIEYIELLLSMRQKAGVSPENPYLFAVPHGTQYINGWAAMREFSDKCGAKDSKTLRGTTLRKQIATTSQLLSLTDNEIAQIADFMGHDEKVHRAVYRQQSLTLQITRIAKFFMAVGDPNVQQFKGKTIEELAVIGDNEAESEHETLESEEEQEQNEEVVNDELENRNCHQQIDMTENRIEETETSLEVDEPLDVTLHQSFSTSSTRNKRKRKKPTPTSTPKKSKPTTFEILNELRSPRRRVVRKRKMWSQNEKELVRRQFSRYISEERPPPRSSIATFLKRESKSLGHRDVSGVYAWITSEIQRNKNRCFD